MPAVTASQTRPVTQQPSKPAVVPNPMFEQYVKLELGSVPKFRDIAAMVMLHSAARDGKLDAADKAGIRLVMKKYAGQIEPAAMSLLRQAVGYEKKQDTSKYDVQLVKAYLGYVDGDGKVNAGEADYLLTTARNIGGSKDVKKFLAAQLRTRADVFEPEAKAKLQVFIG